MAQRGLVHYTLKKDGGYFFIPLESWPKFLNHERAVFQGNAEAFLDYIISFVSVTKKQVKEDVEKHVPAEQKHAEASAASGAAAAAAPPSAAEEQVLQASPQPLTAPQPPTAAEAQALQTSPQPLTASMQVGSSQPSGNRDANVVLQQLLDLGTEWLHLQQGSDDGSAAVGVSAEHQLLGVGSISSPEDESRAWEIIRRLLVELLSFAAAAREQGFSAPDVLVPRQQHPPASAAQFLVPFVQVLQHRASSLDRLEQELEDASQALSEDKEDFIAGQLEQQDKLAELKQSMKDYKAKLKEILDRRSSLKAQAKNTEVELLRMREELQELQAKRSDVMSMVELVSVSHLAKLVGGMLHLLPEEEKVAMLSMTAEWAREQGSSSLSMNVLPCVGECQMLLL